MGLFNLIRSVIKESPTPTKNPYSDKYFADMERIETMWSVIQNLKLYTGNEAAQFASLCRQNMTIFNLMVEYDLKNDYPAPKHAPCYVRLAMLYEKQENYKEAIDICIKAIKIGAYDDHSKGKMYGRLARLIRKSGIEVSPEILKLTEV